MTGGQTGNENFDEFKTRVDEEWDSFRKAFKDLEGQHDDFICPKCGRRWDAFPAQAFLEWGPPICEVDGTDMVFYIPPEPPIVAKWSPRRTGWWWSFTPPTEDEPCGFSVGTPLGSIELTFPNWRRTADT